MNGLKFHWSVVFLFLLTACVWAGISSSEAVSESILHQKIQAYLNRAFQSSNARFQWEPLSHVPVWRVGQPFDSIYIDSRGEGAPMGFTIVTFKAAREGRVIRSLNYSVKIHLYRNVWVAKQTIPAGQPIARDNIERVERDVSDLRGEPVLNLEDVEGLLTRKTVSAGQVLRKSFFRGPYCIERGEVATLIFEKNLLRIEVRARALQNGERGETIWFHVPDTRKRLQAQVIGKNLAVLK